MSLENQEENLRLLALACSTQYSSGHWDECLQSLQGLGNQNDPRIKHNELVVKYYKAGCSPSATESLLSSLTKLSNSPDNQGLTCARYNMAVLKFQLQHFSMAFDILVSILSSTETQEKYLSMRCAFLLIETCMRMKSLDRKTLRTALELLEKALPQLKKGAASMFFALTFEFEILIQLLFGRTTVSFIYLFFLQPRQQVSQTATKIKILTRSYMYLLQLH